MRRLLFIFIFYFLALFHADAQVSKPDIVFFIADDMGYYETSLYAGTGVKTPNLLRLGKEGMIFDNVFIASPSCAPSRAALLTGLMPSRNGAEANHSYPAHDVPLMTKSLQNAGYEVIAFGKVAHGKMNGEAGFDFYNGSQDDLSKGVENYFKDHPVKKPVCLIVGDSRPHVPWSKQLTYSPSDISIPPFFIDTKQTRLERARYYTDITGMDNELGEVLEVANKNLRKNFISLFSSDHGAQWPFAKWNLYDAGIRTPFIIVWPGKIEAGTRTESMISWVDIFPTLLDMVGEKVPKNIDGRSFKKVLYYPSLKHRKQIFTTHSGDGIQNIYPIRSVRTKHYKYILNLHPEYYHTNHSDLLRKDGAASYWDSWDSVAAIDANAKKIIDKYYIRPKEEFYNLQADKIEMVNLINNSDYKKEIGRLRKELKKWMTSQKDKEQVFNKPYLNSQPLPDLRN